MTSILWTSILWACFWTSLCLSFSPNGITMVWLLPASRMSEARTQEKEERVNRCQGPLGDVNTRLPSR